MSAKRKWMLDNRRVAIGLLVGLLEPLIAKGRSGISTKTIEGYARNLRGAVRGLWNGTFDTGAFIVQVGQALERAFEQAWTEGARSQGVEPDERTPDEEAKLTEMISTQSSFIPGLADFVLEHAKVDVTAPPTPVEVEEPPEEFIPTPAEPVAPTPTGTGETYADTVSYRQSKLSPEFDDAIQKMDSVIGTGQGKFEVAMRSGPDLRGEGAFIPDDNKIQIKFLESGNEMNTLHELGHKIDHKLLVENLGGDPGWQWASNQISNPDYFIEGIKEIDDFWDVVNNSDTIKKMRRLQQEQGDQIYEYFLDNREIFARSFSQYIAEKTQDEALLWELGNMLEGTFYDVQWATSDFKPIKKAFDALFEAAGMLK
jgi:hypothetical protein